MIRGLVLVALLVAPGSVSAQSDAIRPLVEWAESNGFEQLPLGDEWASAWAGRLDRTVAEFAGDEPTIRVTMSPASEAETEALAPVFQGLLAILDIEPDALLGLVDAVAEGGEVDASFDAGDARTLRIVSDGTTAVLTLTPAVPAPLPLGPDGPHGIVTFGESLDGLDLVGADTEFPAGVELMYRLDSWAPLGTTTITVSLVRSDGGVETIASSWEQAVDPSWIIASGYVTLPEPGDYVLRVHRDADLVAQGRVTALPA